jgi:hypothetical protein
LINKDALHLGSVTGTVSDASGALITNAKVTVVGPEGQKSATSDAAGRFSFDQLAAGSYLFNVDAPGFRKTVSEVAVLSEKPTKADFRLQVGSAAETVIVQQAAAEAQPAVTRAFVQNPVRDESILLSQAQAQEKTEGSESATSACGWRAYDRSTVVTLFYRWCPTLERQWQNLGPNLCGSFGQFSRDCFHYEPGLGGRNRRRPVPLVR